MIKVFENRIEMVKSLPKNLIIADHKYNGCLLDLEMSYKKVKNGGYIMGHDYEQNFDKAKKTYNFGVNKAVNDFCEKNKQEITMKGNDGCVSFAIKLNKL
jgi:phage host-nuclease inhibitor protein Gam